MEERRGGGAGRKELLGKKSQHSRVRERHCSGRWDDRCDGTTTEVQMGVQYAV